MGICASLYIHIPFCLSKCAYCDFYSIPAKNGVPQEYVESLILEANFRALQYNIDFWRTVYVGGGTPSLLQPEQLEYVLQSIFKIRPLQKGGEVTVEVNPSSFTQNWLNMAKKAGVTRISAGIQALNNKILDTVSRTCRKNQAEKLLYTLQTQNDFDFSADIIAGLPNQSKKSFIHGLHKVILYNPAHVSLYTLTVEKNTPLFKSIQKGVVTFSEDFADDLWLTGKKILKNAGYEQYEVSNFAKKGFESKHNEGYWNGLPYAGIGAGACGTIGAVRYTNVNNIEIWQNAVRENRLLTVQETEILDTQTQITEYVFTAFRTLRGLNAQDFEARFGKKVTFFIEPAFSQWQKKGLAVRIKEKNKDFYALNESGILFLNKFLKELTV